jgi:hypothetical protein
MDAYNPITVRKSGITKTIVSKFALAPPDKREVTLLNVYKGVPITYSASVIKVINDRLTVKVHKNQALCLNIEGQTYIRSKLFDKPIKAKVMSVNTVEQIAILTELTFADPSIGKREAIRVGMDRDEQTTVVIISRNSDVRLLGKLIDISSNGIGVEVIALPEVISENFSTGSWVYISLSLPVPGENKDQEMTLPGTIRYAGNDQETHTLGIQISPNKEIEARIHEYIAQRHSEILNEVEQYSDTYKDASNIGNWWYPV